MKLYLKCVNHEQNEHSQYILKPTDTITGNDILAVEITIGPNISPNAAQQTCWRNIIASNA